MPPALSLHPVAVAYWHRCRVTAAAVVVVGVVADHGLSSWSWSTYRRWSAGGGLLSSYGWPAIVVVQAHTKVIVVVQLTDDAELPTPGDCQFRKCGPARRLGQATCACNIPPPATASQRRRRQRCDDNDGTTPVDHGKIDAKRRGDASTSKTAAATIDTFGRRGDDDDDDGATPVDHSKAIPIDHDDEATQQ
ncbi:hypothetical protein EDB89DRAFT_1907438 [Lactarius sanguifluus]|nr:hypothetical protein EDB89DRAFT_1907438 [Lactarius sanguifluus]